MIYHYMQQAISPMLYEWTEIIDFLSQTLPAQGTYFMQILMIWTTLTAAYEMFRVYPLSMAILRSRIGPNLTEKERRSTYMGLRPLNDPPPFKHADYTSRLVSWP